MCFNTVKVGIFSCKSMKIDLFLEPAGNYNFWLHFSSQEVAPLLRISHMHSLKCITGTFHITFISILNKTLCGFNKQLFTFSQH